MQQPTEKTFLAEGGVTVTNSRFIVPTQTFAMSGITSVKTFEEKPSRTGPVVVLIIGLLALVGGTDAIVMALIFLAVGAVWFAAQKSMFHVLLNTASGEAKALSSQDGLWISKVVEALNNSIVYRG